MAELGGVSQKSVNGQSPMCAWKEGLAKEREEASEGDSDEEEGGIRNGKRGGDESSEDEDEDSDSDAPRQRPRKKRRKKGGAKMVVKGPAFPGLD